MAAFAIARIFGPRVLSFVAFAATSRRTARAVSFLPERRVCMRRRIDLSVAAAMLLITASEVVVAVWVGAAVAIWLYGIVGAAW